MSSGLNAARGGALLGLLALGLLSAPVASASDTFSINNESKVATLIGTSLWGKGNTMADECRTGPFPGPTLTSFTFNPGDQGSITLSQDPFSKCLSGVNPLVDNPITSPFLTNARWNWIPDDPVIGFASLTCYSDGGYGTQPIESSVDGLTCTFYDPSPQEAGSFSSSAAPIRGGNAVAYIQHFPGAQSGAPPGKKASSRGRYEVILRSDKGNVHGRETTTIVSGDSRKVSVPISDALQKQVANAKKDYVQVEAVLRRVDGKPGTGDRATITVMKDRPSLPF